MSITAVMTVMNEELLIDLAIKSAREFVDEFVIVDNGCSDNTIDVAKECIQTWGLQARFYKFKGTLRKAREFSFTKARLNWAFLHDGDHILQTKGRHSILKSKELTKRNPIRCYRYPLVRLYYDYYHTQKQWQEQPPHKLLFCNKPKCWALAAPKLNIPHTTSGIKVVGEYAVWNVCIKQPWRILERQYWRLWRDDGRPGTIREYVCKEKNININQFENYAAEWLVERTRSEGFIKPDVRKFGGYPAVIQEEVDAGVNRTSLDTPKTIRQKRIEAGLSEI